MFMVSSSRARDVLPDLMKRATQSNDAVGITKYGRVEAVLISIEKYERLSRNLFSDE